MTSTTESFHKNSGYLDPKWLALYICCRLCDTENKAFPEKIGSNFRKWFVPGRNIVIDMIFDIF